MTIRHQLSLCLKDPWAKDLEPLTHLDDDISSICVVQLTTLPRPLTLLKKQIMQKLQDRYNRFASALGIEIRFFI